ncbi:MAG TPA: flavodoxin family protein [Firmicutes bacterium]|jgi:multimeric flavodoxin WrbA|nr:flavodoxin family protein [Bacillota bacterium]
MAQIVVLNGSPHEHGSTAALVGEILKGIDQQGIKVNSYYLNGMNIHGCQGCNACRSKGRCVQQDDMQPIYDDIAEADGIIMATPVYMWQVTAQLKQAIDRLFPFLKFDYSSYLKPGKKVLLAATQGRDDTALFRPYFEHVGKNLVFLGFGAYKIFIAGETHQPEDLYRQPQVMAEVGRLGEWLTK